MSHRHVHHWKLDTPNGRTATGRCTKCGAEAAGMENSTSYNSFNAVLNPVKAKGAKAWERDEADQIVKREGWT